MSFQNEDQMCMSACVESIIGETVTLAGNDASANTVKYYQGLNP